MHNNHGIHGACTTDVLHALLLGMFRYIYECFFEQIGTNSKLSDELMPVQGNVGTFFLRKVTVTFPKCTLLMAC